MFASVNEGITDKTDSSGPSKKSVSLGDIAKAANVSRTTVSYALREFPGIPQETRERIKKIARELGYTPDPRMAFKMDQVRGAKARAVVPIAWLNMDIHRDVWSKELYLKPYLAGAMERCEEMGYRLDEFWGKEPGMTMRRISSILYSRGIQGVIIAPSNYSVGHIRLEWQNFASVCFDKNILAPRLHRVVHDYFYNITLALKVLRRSGYRRIGVFLALLSERRSQHTYSAGIAFFHSVIPEAERIAPLIFRHETVTPVLIDKFFAWFEQTKPDVIICQHSEVIGWLRSRGYRVPEDIGVAHLGVEDDVKDWAGIWQRKREIGVETAETVISMVQNRRFGLPTLAHDTLIQGRWQPGNTLLIPKPKPA